MMERSDVAELEAENERLLAELDKAKALMREEVNKLQSSIRQDMNLEKVFEQWRLTLAGGFERRWYRVD